MSRYNRAPGIHLALLLFAFTARGEWSSDYLPPGPPGLVPYAVAELAGKLVAGGRSQGPYSHVQMFDGGEWKDVGSIKGQILALAEHDGHLVAAGRGLNTSLMTSEVSLMVWNGHQWNTWPQEISGSVNALLSRNGVLYVGGRFERAGSTVVNNVAAWTGDSWDNLNRGFDHEVHSLCWHAGALYAAGRFTSASGVPVYGVAAWDGRQWSALRGGILGKVTHLVSHSGRLIAGGSFAEADGKAVSGLAQWDGTSWDEVGGGLAPVTPAIPIAVEAMVSTGLELVIAGEFQVRSDSSIKRLGAWDGQSWRQLSVIRRHLPADLTLAWQSSKLIMGADRLLDAEPAACRLVAYDGGIWSPVGGGSFAEPQSDFDLKSFRDSAPVIGQPLPTAAMLAPPQGDRPLRIRASTVWRGQVLGAGPFARPLGTAGQSLCAWDSSGWRTLADLPFSGVPDVRSLLPAEKRLILLGDFWSVADKSALDACAWDGSEFVEFRTPRPGWRQAARAMWRGTAVVALDSSSRHRTRQDRCLLASEGDTWRELPHPGATIQTLCDWDGELVAALYGGETGRTTLAAFDGRAWRPLPGEFVGSVNSLTVYDGALVATGGFDAVDSLVCHNVAFADGSLWRPLEEGVDGYVMSASSASRSLWLAGSFWRAGTQISAGFARWDGPLPRGRDVSEIPRYIAPTPRVQQDGPLVDGWHSHGLDAREPARELRNGDFSDWDGDRPVAWEAMSTIYDPGNEQTLAPERLPGGGIRLRLDETRGRIDLQQRFRATPGQSYKLRVLGRLRATSPAQAPLPVSVRLGDYVRGPGGHEYGPLHGEIAYEYADTAWTWWEAQLAFDPEADVGVASITSWRGPVVLEVRRLEIEPVHITATDVVGELFDQLEARFVSPCGDEVDWSGLRVRYLEVAESTGIEHCRKLVSTVLGALPPAELEVMESTADVTQIGIVESSPLDCDSGSEDIQSSRDGGAVAKVFTPQLGNRSRDGILLCSELEDMADLSGVRGVILDLRSGALLERFDWRWRREKSDSPPWGVLGPWANRRHTFGLKHERRLGATGIDSLVVNPMADDRTRIPLVAIIDRTTRGVSAVVAAACLSLDGVRVLGEPTGPPSWPSACFPLASGQSVIFPDSWFTWLMDGMPVDAVRIPPTVFVEDLTSRTDGEDPRLGEALRLIRLSFEENR